MTFAPLARRAAAFCLLAALLFVVGNIVEDWIAAYTDGQHDIKGKRVQLRNLRDLVQARAEFGHLAPKAPKTSFIMRSSDGAQEALSAQITHAADGQQVIVDGVETLPSTSPALVTAIVRVRGTQGGVYSFLRAIEDETPYLTVPRFELSLVRAADLDQNKPLILSSELHVAALVSPPSAAPSTGTQPDSGSPAQ
jgi:hypothetical protein